jgi:Uma2 family endonuclease
MSNGNDRPAFGAEHGIICANIAYELKQYLTHYPVGVCFGAGTGFVVDAATGRTVVLDAAFVRTERVPAGGLPVSVFQGAPDLAVIVVSPTDKFDEVEADVHDLLAAGCSHVWILRPRVRMVTVQRPRNDLAIVGGNESLTAQDVLPSFELPLPRLFDLPSAREP